MLVLNQALQIWYREPDIYQDLYRQSRTGIGTVSRQRSYDTLRVNENKGHGTRSITVIFEEGGEVQGFARYRVAGNRGGGGSQRMILWVTDMHTRTFKSWSAIWKYLMRVDLVDEVRASGRPLDEPLELLFIDPRVCRTESVDDDLWLRLVDVYSGLSLRSFSDQGRLVLEVVDAHSSGNIGRYQISANGVQRTSQIPQISVTAGSLGSVYLGDRSWNDLVATSQASVHDFSALPIANSLFATPRSPWCGTSL